MRRIILVVMEIAILVVSIASLANAAQVTLAWGLPADSVVDGYRVFTRTPGSSYDYNNPIWTGTSTQCSLTLNGETMIVSRAFNSYGESGDSNEVSYQPTNPYALDQTYTASNGAVINITAGVIDITVASAPSDAKTVYWQKSDLPAIQGKLAEISFVMTGPAGAPVSLYLENSAHERVSRERHMFVGSESALYSLKIPVNYTDIALLKVVPGFVPGDYQFQQIQVRMIDPIVAPVTEMFLRSFKPPAVPTNKYRAEFLIRTPPGAEQIAVKVAKTVHDIETSQNLVMDVILAAQPATTFEIDVGSALYTGFYVSAATLIGGEESVFQYVSHLPGNVTGNEDEFDPPVYLNQIVNQADIDRFNLVKGLPVPGLPPPTIDDPPADYVRRANNKVDATISTLDLPLISSQKTKGAKMQ